MTLSAALLRPIWLVCCLAGLTSACSDSTPTHPANHSEADMPSVNTLQGRLQGSFSFRDHIRVFRGIPYAQPPVGKLRWQPPQTLAAWSGERPALEFSASCVQAQNSSTFVWRRGQFAVSEDCLYLNVWAKSNADNLPVMVWFHGGAHTSGQGHSTIFDGTHLADRDVVVVSINYRLGPLGFLAHPWLAAESAHDSAGNYGLLDKIAALNWVRDNIGAFGGDPENVTIFGQSAGSQSVCSLMASPLADGLFHKAIGQSAACVGPAPRKDANGMERGAALVAASGATDINALRALSGEALLTAAEHSGWANRDRIVIDGWVLAEPQVDVFKTGRHHKVPLLLGSLANEGHELFPINQQMSAAELQAFADNLFGAQATAVLAAYASQAEVSPGAAQHAIATDLFMTFAMRRWAQYSQHHGAPTYLYFMDHVPPAFHLYMPEDPVLGMPQGPRSGGAYHSGDLAFVFNNTHLVGTDWRDDDHRLSDLMAAYWTNFAHTGDPNGPGLPVWPMFDSEHFTTQRLNMSPAPAPTAGVRRAALDPMAKAMPM